MLPNKRVFEAATFVGFERQLAGPVWPALGYDNLIRVGVYH